MTYIVINLLLGSSILWYIHRAAAATAKVLPYDDENAIKQNKIIRRLVTDYLFIYLFLKMLLHLTKAQKKTNLIQIRDRRPFNFNTSFVCVKTGGTISSLKKMNVYEAAYCLTIINMTNR